MPVLNGLAYQSVAFDIPLEDRTGFAKAINTGVLNWPQAAGYTLDVTQSNQLLEVQNIQSIFVDNSQSLALLKILVSGSGQTLWLPPQSQGVFPLIAGDRPILYFTSGATSGFSQAWLLNTPNAPMIWASQTSFPVSDNVQYSGNVSHPALVANVSVSGSVNALSTTLVTGAPGYYINTIILQPNGNVSFAVAANLLVSLTDSSSGLIMAANFWIPGGAANTTYPPYTVNLPWNNKIANSQLNLVQSATFNAGLLTYTVTYGLCNFVG